MGSRNPKLILHEQLKISLLKRLTMSLLSIKFMVFVFGIIVVQITAQYSSANDIQDQTYGYDKYLNTELQARSFKPIEIDFDVGKYPRCNNTLLIHNKRFFIQRKKIKKDGVEKYAYFATEQSAGAFKDARSIVHGSKKGSCSLVSTARNKNQNCGFDEHVLKYCFQEEGKQQKIPLKKTGFDPTKKGPYKWKNQKLAKEAGKSCDVMVHAKLPYAKKLPTDLMTALNVISHAIEAAKMARFGSSGEKVLDTVFLDPYENSDKMTIANFDVFKKLFPRQNPKLEKNQALYKPLVPRVLPNMYFCVCNDKCGKLIGKSDLKTNAIIQDILKAIK